MEHDRFGERAFSSRRAAMGLDMTVNRVCRACNNGWMSTLERRSRPVLEPLIEGLSRDALDRRSQRVLALWAAKTAAVADLTQVRPGLSDADRRMLTHSRIPGHVRVWYAACEAYQPSAQYHTTELRMEPLDGPDRRLLEGSYIALKIGHLGLMVAFPRISARWQFVGPLLLAGVPIWPRTHQHVPWPPLMVSPSTEALEEFFDAFWRGAIIAYS